MPRRIILLVLGLSFPVLAVGCLGLFSKQEYGPNPTQQAAAFTVGAPIGQAMNAVGAPDAVYTSGKQTLYVFRRIEGFQVLSLFGQLKKTDLIITTEDGVIKQTNSVAKGEGLSILSPILLPASETE